MNTPGIVALCLLSTLLACGCLRYRSVAAADVKDVGTQICTRYRYCPSWAQGKEKSGEERLRTRMKRYQPQVFADDGIPIVITEREVSHEDWGCWKINRYQDPMGFASKRFFYAFSFSIIPLFNGTESDAWEEVRLADDPSPATSFRIYKRQDNAFSFLTPLPLLLYSGLPEMRGSENGVVRVRRENFFTVAEDMFAHEHPEGEEVFAYALAAKLKALEDMGRVNAATLEWSARTLLHRKDSIAQNVARKASVPISQTKTGVQSQTHRQVKPLYRIDSLVRESNSDFAYTFSLKMNEDPSIEAFFAIQGVFMREVLDAYRSEFPNADVSTLRVYVLPRLVDGRIEGRAAVLTITPVSLSYDANTRRGKLSIRFNPGQYEEARAWARKNIETLARDKNIVLVTGQIPPDAKYYSLGEKIDGNVMEIEFRTE